MWVMGAFMGGGSMLLLPFLCPAYGCCMNYLRYEYSFSQAILDERRNGCAPCIIHVRLLSLCMAEEVRPDTPPRLPVSSVPAPSRRLSPSSRRTCYTALTNAVPLPSSAALSAPFASGTSPPSLPPYAWRS
jgi:hypothetical protein